MRKEWVLRLLMALLISHFSLLICVAQSDRQLVRQGNKQFRQGNAAEAEVSYRKAVEKNQRNPQANYNLGNALMMQRKDSLAVAQLEKAAKQETNPLRRAQAYHNMGVVCQQHQMFGEAIEAYKEALRNNPADDQTRYNLALCKRQQKNNNNQDNKDNNKQDQKDKQDKQQQQQKQDQQKKQEQQDQQMSKENAEQLLNAAMQEEKQTQERMKKAMQQPQKRRLEKNW